MRSRVVLAPLGWCQVGDDALHRADDGDSNVTDTGDSTKETVKTTRAGKAGSCSVEPVVTTARALSLFAYEAAGAAGARHSLRPHHFGRVRRITRTRLRRGNAETCVPSLFDISNLIIKTTAVHPSRHARACRGHPRLTYYRASQSAWMAGSSPATTKEERL